MSNNNKTTSWNFDIFYHAIHSSTSSSSLGTPSITQVKGTEGIDAVILLNAAIPTSFLELLWTQENLKICADGGSNRFFDNYQSWAIQPDYVIGDLDSIRDDVLQYYSKSNHTKVLKDEDQDTTDLEKCFAFVTKHNSQSQQLATKISRVFVFGPFGGNLSHELANLSAMYGYYSSNDVEERLFLVSNDNVAVLLQPGQHTIACKKQSYCSIVPLGFECKQISTSGLRWNLNNESLTFGKRISTSNEMAEDCANITVSHSVLFIVDFHH